MANNITSNITLQTPFVRSILVICSALLFAIGFLAPAYCWWTSAVFLVPLFFIYYTHDYPQAPALLSFCILGFIWGLVAFSVHSYGILYSVFSMADTHPWYLILFYFGALIYIALCTSVWFWLMSLLAGYADNSLVYRTGIVIAVTLAYLFFIDQCVLWPLHRLEGYPLANPLLPLAYYPQLLTPLAHLGIYGMLTLLIAIQALIALIISKQYRYSIITLCSILCIALLVIYIYSYSTRNIPVQTPTWLNNIVVFAQAFYNPDNYQKTVTQVTDHLKKLLACYPQARVIVMPESALFMCDLYSQPALTAAYSAALKPDSILITGGIYAPDPKTQYNTVYIVKATGTGNLEKFCKRHAMALTEQLSSFWDTTLLRNAYYTKRPAITPACNKRPVVTLMPGVYVVPYICSELFFTYYPDDTFTHLPIIALCNDSWITTAYAKKLMYLYAQLKSQAWQRPIIYVAYDHAYYVDRTIRHKLAVYKNA